MLSFLAESRMPKQKSYQLGEEELMLVLEKVLKDSGIANHMSPEEQKQLVKDTAKNLLDSNADINVDNIKKPEVVMGLLTALTRTHAENYAAKNNLPFKKFDYSLPFVEKNLLTEKQQKELDSVEKLTGLKLTDDVAQKVIDDLEKALTLEAPKPGAPQPKSKLVAIVDANANVIETTGAAATKGRGQTSIQESNVEKMGWYATAEHLRNDFSDKIPGILDFVDEKRLNSLTSTPTFEIK